MKEGKTEKEERKQLVKEGRIEKKNIERKERKKETGSERRKK